MKVLQLIGVIVFLFLFVSCNNNLTEFENEHPEGSVVLKYKIQQRADVDFLLEVLDINDTRCPIGSVCSDPGKVSVNLRVLTNSGVSETCLEFSEIPGRCYSCDTIENRRIEVFKVSPIPYADKPTNLLTNYSVVVVVNDI
ncbi:MAG: hypothetical protein JXA77_02215 [Bacteroidales bacterium]|nr:hypothetical protein [Bacteroidales bacterium]